MCAPPIGISSTRRTVGNSPACAWPETGAEPIDTRTHNGEATPRYEFFDLKPALPDMAAEVLHGLALPAKSIPPKYFYDAEGSRLFDVITKLPGYYLTRVETAILRDNRNLIAGRVGTGTCLVEYGSGSSVKSRLLIEACRPAAYVPVDISRDHLEQSARAIYDGYPGLAVYPTCADYTAPFELPPPVTALPRLAFFPGSSIGNFEPTAAGEFLRGVAQVVDAGGWLVVGVDAKKDSGVLDRAYTDADGITEQFNKNLLANINNALGADLDLAGFHHLAVYNEQAGRIEMYLVSQREQRVEVAGTEIAFAKGERLHTENSYKYAPDEFVAIAEQSGFECVDVLTDDRAYFMVLLLRAR